MGRGFDSRRLHHHFLCWQTIIFVESKVMNNTRILIVADVRETVDELREFFELNDYDTEVALKTKVALAILDERRMDLAIIGFTVQEIPGIEILKELRTKDPCIPVILIQGSSSKQVKSLIKKAGAQGYIPNPFDRIDFLHTVKKVLSSHTSRVS